MTHKQPIIRQPRISAGRRAFNNQLPQENRLPQTTPRSGSSHLRSPLMLSPSSYFEKTSKQRHQDYFEEPLNVLIKQTSTIIIITPVLLPTTLSVVLTPLTLIHPSFFSCPSAFCLLKNCVSSRLKIK